MSEGTSIRVLTEDSELVSEHDVENYNNRFEELDAAYVNRGEGEHFFQLLQDDRIEAEINVELI